MYFLQKPCDNPESRKPISDTFSNLICSFLVSVSLLVGLKIFQSLSLPIPLRQSPTQRKSLTLIYSMKPERDKEATKEMSEASRFWSMKFKERFHLHYINVQAKQEELIQQLLQVIQETKLRQLTKVARLNNRFSMQKIRRGGHPALS